MPTLNEKIALAIFFFVFMASAYDRRQVGADFRAIHLPEIYEMTGDPVKLCFMGNDAYTKQRITKVVLFLHLRKTL